MAIYYFNLAVVQRSKARSIAKAIASIFGVTSSVSKTNQTYSYLIKCNDLLHKKTMLPFQTQSLIGNCSKLWDYLVRNKDMKEAIHAKKQSEKSVYKIKDMVMQSLYLLSSDKSQKRFKVDKELN